MSSGKGIVLAGVMRTLLCEGDAGRGITLAGVICTFCVGGEFMCKGDGAGW